MAFQVSPGVNVTEIDKTERVSPAVTSDAAIAAGFKWGPVDKITTITSERDLVAEYGKPDNDTAANWLTASSFLAYGGILQVIRTAGTDAKNAVSNSAGTTGTGTIVNDGAGYSVGTLDTNANLFSVGETPVQGATTGLKLDVVANTSGVVTGVTVNAVPTVEYTDGETFYVSIIAGSQDAIVKVVKGTGAAKEDYAVTVISGGSNYAPGTTSAVSVLESKTHDNTKYDISVDQIGAGGIVTAASFTGLSAGHGLVDGDMVVDNSGTGENELVLKFTGGASAVLVKNEDQYDAGVSLSTSAFVARYPGALGNGITVSVFHDGTIGGWEQTHIQNGASKVVEYGALFDRDPGTSNYVLTKNNNNVIGDEIHIVVIDAGGDISGIRGTVLEKYAHVSLASDAKDENGNSNYYKDVIRRDSKYIYASGQWDDLGGTIAGSWEAATSATTGTLENSTIANETNTDSQEFALTGGVADNTSSGGNGDAARYTADQKGYGLLRDTDTTDVGIVISGDATSQIQSDVISNVAEYRKDAIAVISPENSSSTKGVIIGTGTNSTKADALVAWANALTSSSYGVADSGYKRMYDAYNDVYRDVPLNGDIAGLMVRTENNQDAWWSPAGFTRGQIKNVVKLHFNPDKAARDSIYKAGVNPVVSMPGQGTLLYGDKTLLSKPSAFDRINVRRLFVVLEKSISRAAKNLLFEFNDEFTRASFKNMVEPFLRNIKARRGVYDYLVICDSTNNTSEVIDRNEFVGDIFIKPARSINYIQLNFVAVRSGVEFSEVVGSV